MKKPYKTAGLECLHFRQSLKLLAHPGAVKAIVHWAAFEATARSKCLAATGLETIHRALDIAGRMCPRPLQP